MSANENEFQFELKEKLYFNEGELVDELMNISLDPEISIKPTESYVSIHGEIELRGIYKKATATLSEDELTVDFDDFEAKRYVRTLPAEEEGLMEFIHRFPVDISVPSYRIDTIDSIQVEITNFDYEFPANDQLNITAGATIYGIKEDVDLLQATSGERADTSSSNIKDESFEFEIKRPHKEIEEEIVSSVKTEQSQPELEHKSNEEIEISVIESAKEYQEDERELGEKLIGSETGEEGQISAEKEQETVIQDVSYLTDIFRDEEEERFSSMRICIAQEEDTIETIAERFEVSALQLIKQNELEEDFEINEGQLLYIPKR